MYEKFVNLYPVSKTLKFKLIPVGKTEENLLKTLQESDSILQKDFKRASSYQKMKKLIDQEHKKLIEELLSNASIDIGDLKQYKEAYEKNDKENMKFFSSKLRKSLVKSLNEGDLKITKEKIFGKGLIDLLLENNKNEEDISIIKDFKDFTTYFSGFNQNRQNMYNDEEKHSSIPYRVFNENLPKFIKNIKNYENIKNIFDRNTIRELKEELGINDLDSVFLIDSYKNYISQSGIEKYNNLITGFTKKDGSKIQGLNEYVNEYNQYNDKKLPYYEVLYKQILSDTNTISYVDEKYIEDTQVFSSINDIIIEYGEKLNILKDFFKLSYNKEKIYFKDNRAIDLLSCKLFGKYNYINARLEEKKISKSIYSVKDVETALNDLEVVYDQFDLLNCIIKDYIDKVNTKMPILKDLIDTKKDNISLRENHELINNIKDLLDLFNNMSKIYSLFDIVEDSLEVDNDFYNSLRVFILPFFDLVLIVYNRIRNYVTKKPYSIEKIKLNFNNYNLLNGWDVNKEQDNLGVIFIKDDRYFLGIMDKKAPQSFKKTVSGLTNYKKMIYKQIPSCAKYYSSKQICPTNPPENIKKYLSKEFDKKAMTKIELKELITYVAEVFIPNYKPIHDENGKCYYNYKFKPYDDYLSWNDFCKDLDKQSYSIDFVDVDSVYVDKLVEDGKLYLFEIYNKDFSKNKKNNGTPNLHTMYWDALFDTKNKENLKYKLNGGGEIFYREKSYHLGKNDVHKANTPIAKRSDESKSSTFSYDLIKNKRYTVDQFEFHVPITIYPNASASKNVNEMVKNELKINNDVNIIGIDRGERNLIYISVINSKGEILEQRSLNEIINEYKGNSYKVNYQQLLSKIQKDRQNERKSWTEIEKIKELKSGYMSIVINEVMKLMLKYNAIIILEDLGGQFKNSRVKIEKQVYQTFENALINKLSLYINKKYSYEQYAGLYNPLQMVKKPDNKSFKSMQNGFVFYVPAWKTSKIDPTTGFTNEMNLNYSSINSSKNLIKKFNKILFDDKLGLYCFETNYREIIGKDKQDVLWKVYSYGDRIAYSKNDNAKYGEYKKIDLTEEYNNLFREYNIDLNKDLKDQILQQNTKQFYEQLLDLLKLTFQLRNSSISEDYIISPVINRTGKFFDSRNYQKNLPVDADANGAYCIALKGLMIVNSIKNEINNFKVTNEAWLDFMYHRNK